MRGYVAIKIEVKKWICNNRAHYVTTAAHQRSNFSSWYLPLPAVLLLTIASLLHCSHY